MAEAEVAQIKKESFAGHVWSTLSAIDCSKHVEHKQGLAYLSWAWAWGILMQNFPESEFAFGEMETRQDGTVTVWCTVNVLEGGRNVERTMWLPVMDHRNKAIQNPDAFAINTARMRCMVKCLALFGLGHYIYAGEDLPAGSPVTETLIISEAESAEIKHLLEVTVSDVQKFLAAMAPGCQTVDTLPKKAYETALKALHNKAERMGVEP
ncbi:MAG: DUF1071 domain-containing protein [Gammaproteobacteria bacterium]|nr:DUF1071 domain-containing protein [Gammaproteobacteria bacterium]